MSTPVQWVLTWVFDGVAAVGNGYVALRGAREEANACRTQLAEAHAELNALKEAQAENERLRVTLGYVEASADQEIVARVIGLNPSTHFNPSASTAGKTTACTRACR